LPCPPCASDIPSFPQAVPRGAMINAPGTMPRPCSTIMIAAGICMSSAVSNKDARERIVEGAETARQNARQSHRKGRMAEWIGGHSVRIRSSQFGRMADRGGGNAELCARKPILPARTSELYGSEFPRFRSGIRPRRCDFRPPRSDSWVKRWDFSQFQGFAGAARPCARSHRSAVAQFAMNLQGVSVRRLCRLAETACNHGGLCHYPPVSIPSTS
jgi:hypothetical protein